LKAIYCLCKNAAASKDFPANEANGETARVQLNCISRVNGILVSDIFVKGKKGNKKKKQFTKSVSAPLYH
jgi:hypothetical protein